MERGGEGVVYRVGMSRSTAVNLSAEEYPRIHWFVLICEMISLLESYCVYVQVEAGI